MPVWGRRRRERLSENIVLKDYNELTVCRMVGEGGINLYYSRLCSRTLKDRLTTVRVPQSFKVSLKCNVQGHFWNGEIAVVLSLA